MAIVSKFLASKWVTVALILALAGGTFYVYRQGKLLGSAGERVERYESTIEQQAAQLETLRVEAERRQQVNQELASQMVTIKQSFGAVRRRIQNAEAEADKALKECLDMHIADGMQFGPSSDPGAGDS